MISTVHNDMLHFLEISPRFRVIHTLPVNVFLDPETDTHALLADIQHHTNMLLVMPDYWIGNTLYQLQSNRKSLVEAFLTRKLQADYKELHEVSRFYNYLFPDAGKKEQSIYVFFLQDPMAFRIYEKLKLAHLEPVKMTTPSFILENKVKHNIKEFHQGGKCLIHMLLNECFIYFYYQGNFLFDRVITFPEVTFAAEQRTDSGELTLETISPQDITGIVTYEINQSLFLFSQKTKSDIDNFYLLSSRDNERERLKTTLDRDIENLNTILNLNTPDTEMENRVGPVASFTAADISQSQNYLTISNRDLKNRLEWRPVKMSGLIIGICLFCVLCMESLFIFSWFKSHDIKSLMATPESRQVLDRYNEALDALIREHDQPDPKQMIEKMVISLPDNVIFDDVTIEFENHPNIDFNGTMTVAGPDHVKSTLSQLVAGLNANLPVAQPVTIEHIDFNIDPQKTPGEKKNYLLSFNIKLK